MIVYALHSFLTLFCDCTFSLYQIALYHKIIATTTEMKRSRHIQLSSSSLLLFLLIVYQPQLKAQSFNKGTVAVNAGVGFISTIRYYSVSGLHRTPVFSLSGEYGIMKLGPGVLGGGLAFGYQSASYTSNYGSLYYKDKWSTTMFGIRGTYHPDFLNSDKYDLYGIVQLSITHFGYSFSTNDPYINTYQYGNHTLSTSFHPYLLVGAKYYFTKNFGVYSELGYDISLIKLGLTFKFDTAK